MNKVLRYVMAEAKQSFGQRTAKPKILVIAGATSVGKTELSLKLAALLNGEVISADSVQVYRRLNIGSAKVSESEAGVVRHHLLDVADSDPDVIFSVKSFVELAEKAIEDITSRGRVPMVVGGTSLYLRTLLQGMQGSPASTHESRAMVQRIFEEEDEGQWEKSLSRLKAIDPVYAESLSTNNWRRLQRALDICIHSGRTVTSFKKSDEPEDWVYDARCLFLTMPRVQLFERIDARCEVIVEAGLIQEVIKLVKCGLLTPESQAGRSVGYRQALDFLETTWGFPTYKDGVLCQSSLKIPKENLKQTFCDFLFTYKSRTRNMAQKQLGRYKSENGFQWVNMAPSGHRLNVDDLAKVVAEWFKKEPDNFERKDSSWMPQEWNGTHLHDLTPEESQKLKVYTKHHNSLTVYSDKEKVVQLLSEIEELVTSGT